MIDYDSKSWLRVLFTLHGSVAPRLMPRTVLAASVGGVAAFLFERHAFKFPSIAHTMIGVALGLLLVFRTNASFDRWWEGRKLLGGIVNRTRDMARQLYGYAAGSPETLAVSTTIVRHLDAFFALATQGLRAEDQLDKVLSLTPSERALLTTKKARASVVLSWVTRAVDDLGKRGVLSEARLLAVDTNLTALVDFHSGCERIARTPVPFAYAQHIKLFVTIFCFTAPFAFVESMKWYTPIASSILAYALFGIDEIGVEIEDPFGDDPNDLPMDRIAQTIHTSTSDILSGGG